MSPEEIRLELFKRRKKINQAQIARRVGVSPQAVAGVIDRRIVSDRIMEVVARAIGRDKKYVFPEHYLKKTG